MVLLICFILVISFFDLRKSVKEKHTNDIICFAVIAAACILYGYYYNTHMYTASVVGFFLKLLQIQ